MIFFCRLCTITLVLLSGGFGKNDPSMKDTLVEYYLPRAKDLRRILDTFYRDNPFIYKNITQCEDRQLMWYAKQLAQSIEGEFCPKAVSTSENRCYTDRQHLYAMMLSDRQKIITQKLDKPAPIPLVEHTPFPVDASVKEGVDKGLSLCKQRMQDIYDVLRKNPSMDASRRQEMKNDLLDVFHRLRTKADYVLKQSSGIPSRRDKRIYKTKIALLRRKKPQDFTESDLWSLFYSIGASIQGYEKPVEGMMRALSDRPVTESDIMRVIEKITHLYVPLESRKKRACDWLIYLNMLETLSHIQKSCMLMVNQKERHAVQQAVFDTYRQCHQEKPRDLIDEKSKKGIGEGMMMRYLLPSPVLHEKYGLWKSYLDDLFVSLSSKINQKDFCETVNRFCGDACGKIERDLDVQIIRSREEKAKTTRKNGGQ
jgi:hypothetical protein